MNTQTIPVVEQIVMERLRSLSSFTALDISNALKEEYYAVSHREVAEIVRDIYQTGAMDFYGYERRLIDVITDGGIKKAQALLYLHHSRKEREYTDRQQRSLPCVTADRVRALPDAPSAFALPHPLPPPKPRSEGKRRTRTRRDGAFAVPRTLISQLGWTPGVSVGLSIYAGQVRLTPGGEIPVQIWSDLRVRICRKKLRLYGLMRAETLSVTTDSAGLLIEEN